MTPKDTLLFIVDMQEGMWADNGPEQFDLSAFDEGFIAFLQRQKVRQEEVRHAAIYDMVPPIHDFVETMRPHARPVWVTSLWDGTGKLLDGLGAHRADLRLDKIDHQSAVPENLATIENLKKEGYTNAIVIGAYAGLCVRNTASDLKKQGFNVTVIGDLIIDDVKPGNEEALATALYAIQKEGVTTTWLSDFESTVKTLPTPSVSKGRNLSLDLNG
jgi:nicotinamidase-related amidase